ncbi:unnamed protein product [Kuraishia capsulata CBS 1993]|uniref:Uncharacterized protein n=1 Tax=Kuraishia capsulata CBS 1993 TaxID=1382522 RepID=W6MRF2_9ASCO|nr:uncharacterized protein KUCA_T00003801001 [Kuraishia capsulata CBS 1993]CDK27822.1 unnamed protein product [Kuraishia capsulata CBS 1993]
MVSTRSRHKAQHITPKENSIGGLMNRNSSVANLTTPTLYSIYGGKDDINDENAESDIYANLKEEIRHTSVASGSKGQAQSFPTHRSPTVTTIMIIGKVLVLGVLGILFKELTRALHANNPLLPDISWFNLVNIIELSLKRVGLAPLLHLTDTKLEYVSGALEGIILGLIQPLFDRLTGTSAKSGSTIVTTTMIRSATALVGISYGLKKTEWTSPLQASLAWSCLNPCLWMLLDGTLFGFLSASTISLCSMVCVGLSFGTGYEKLEWEKLSMFEFDGLDETARVFWVGSFFFFGVIFFGKVGRWLF